MTWLKNFFRLRPSSVFIIVFGISTGILGYTYSRLPAKLYDSDKIIYSFLVGSPVILGCLKWINYIISKEIETEVDILKIHLEKDLEVRRNKLDKEIDEKLEKKIHTFMDEYSKDIENLKKDIDALDIPPQKREIILKGFYRLKSAHKAYKRKLKSAEKISSWLAVKENTIILQKIAIDAVKISNFSIDKEYLHKFEKDIEECIKWLKYSVKDRQGYLYQSERQTSAMIESSYKLFEAYKIALNAIQKYIHNEFEDDAVIVKEMLEYIINEITAFVSKHNLNK